ncbi:MAG: radical SAM protein [Desulfobacteraceae bacterium]|jgi:MoaA/NifB/PqqE/SkfB family radical SAM enzyme
MKKTVSFSKNAANLFLHILTRCNLKCAHCYINPHQHGDQILSLKTIETWLNGFNINRSNANLVLLGGEPTLHPKLSTIVKRSKAMGFNSVTVDTNGYLFHDFINKVTPEYLDALSFSLDGATAAINDPLRGKGSFDKCVAGIQTAKEKGFNVSLIYTVSNANIHQLDQMVPLVDQLSIDRFFIQVIGIRGTSVQNAASDGIQQVPRTLWETIIPKVAQRVADIGITVTYPKVFLKSSERFECAGNVADNYFIFPNGRVYQCPLCEDYPLHSFQFIDNQLVSTPRINENDLFQLNIPEGCVMNKIIQPGNIEYMDDGAPMHRIACCLLKDEIRKV